MLKKKNNKENKFSVTSSKNRSWAATNHSARSIHIHYIILTLNLTKIFWSEFTDCHQTCRHKTEAILLNLGGNLSCSLFLSYYIFSKNGVFDGGRVVDAFVSTKKSITYKICLPCKFNYSLLKIPEIG